MFLTSEYVTNTCFSHNLFFNKITELLNDVERLKQALNGLSQLTYGSGSPSKRQSQLIDGLQQQVRSLQQQLAVSTWDLQGFMLCAGSPLLVCKILFRNQINLWLCSDPRM